MKIKLCLVFFLILVSFLQTEAATLNWIHTSKGKKLAFYEKKKNYYITEWDILVEPYKNGLIDEKANSRRFGKWKYGVIPFEVDSTIPNTERIDRAIDYFHQNTSIKLVPRTDQKDYVYFKNNGPDDCSSFVGKKGGMQNINISDWCETGSIIHEILHALGFNHEQSRPDRMKYIKIHWRNIEWKNVHNFFLSPFAKTYGKFDMDSIMLYPSFNGFAKDPTRPTMSLRSGGTWEVQRSKMSENDLRGLEEFYKLP